MPMHGPGHIYGFNVNATRPYSPVTLSNKWPTLGRLLFMVLCASLGTTINGFFVAAFFVERSLHRIGNVFMACIGMADLILTTVVMPVTAVVLLSGEWDSLEVCKFLQFLTEASTYSYSMFFTLVSAETYYRLCRASEEYEAFVSMRIGFMSIMVFIISFTAAAIGVFRNLDYDYCERKHFGNFVFRSATSIVFHFLPCLLTLYGLLTTFINVRSRAREQAYYKRSQQYDRDFSATTLNIVAFMFYVGAWTPYLVIVHEYPDTTDRKFYYSVWIGVCRSVITSFLYSTLNGHFRLAFSHLFYYCCCKSDLSGTSNNRIRRHPDYKSTTGDVRVHIMQQTGGLASPQRGRSSSREMQEL